MCRTQVQIFGGVFVPWWVQTKGDIRNIHCKRAKEGIIEWFNRLLFFFFLMYIYMVRLFLIIILKTALLMSRIYAQKK